ncbi:hypothetical protein HZA86_00490 [Candidatus Uhrbacteria bacterium]|nr:hypothetical protein [Candidatus Uhrbacteria bacterium]
MKHQHYTILISSYGSHLQGLGHIVRDISLYRALALNHEVIFHAAGVTRQVYRKLQQEGVRNIVQGTLRQTILSYYPNLIIYDKPYALGMMESFYGVPHPPVVALDYFYYQDPRICAAINIYNHNLKKGQSVLFRRIYEGLEYSIVRDEVLSYRKQKSFSQGMARRVLLTFGGADPRNNTQKSIAILERLAHPPVSVYVIVGPKFRKGVEYRLGKNHRYRIETNVQEMGALMGSIDIAFCGAGVTLAELMALGCPCVIIPQNNAELLLARSIAKKGGVLLLESRQTTQGNHVQRVQRLIKHWHDREAMGHRAQQLVDGHGRERVLEIIRKELIRHASLV